MYDSAFLVRNTKSFINRNFKLCLILLIGITVAYKFIDYGLIHAPALQPFELIVLSVFAIALLIYIPAWLHIYVAPMLSVFINPDETRWSKQARSINAEPSNPDSLGFVRLQWKVNNIDVVVSEKLFLPIKKYRGNSQVQDRDTALITGLFLYLTYPLLTLFSQSTVAEIRLTHKNPHIIFDNFMSSFGGVKLLDFIQLGRDENIEYRNDVNIYVQQGLEQETLQLLEPDTITKICDAMRDYDIEFTGNRVIIRADHFMRNADERDAFMHTVTTIVDILGQLPKVAYPTSKPKPYSIMDDNALRKSAALKTFIVTIGLIAVLIN